MLTHPILHCELFSRASERLIAVMWTGTGTKKNLIKKKKLLIYSF